MTQLKADFHNPPGTATVGMWLFLASLAMLFFSSMVGYVVIRLTGKTQPELFSVRLPAWLWLSTVVVLAGSVTIHKALTSIRLERQRETLRWLRVTLGLAVLFCVVQTPGMIALLNQHQALQQAETPNHLFGLIFFLVLVHALHVVGGVVGLAFVTWKAGRGAYDHEHYVGIRHSAMYWHFLDGVWIVMFATMLAFG
ncbi:MAG: heme-copper oxidase subunit III [Tepidisphaerales bacterium]